jgi:hypothetical protein
VRSSAPATSQPSRTTSCSNTTTGHASRCRRSLLARRTCAFPRWLATGGLWFAPLLALSGLAFPLNSSALYATLELTLLGLLTWVVASSVVVARRGHPDTSTAAIATV